MTSPRAVLFDMDGVLTANNHFHRQAWKELALELLGLDLSEHDLDTKVDGGRNPEIIERLTGVAPSAEPWVPWRWRTSSPGGSRATRSRAASPTRSPT